jgi:outer membrane protein OmpA-like peptidoglycan-associated protein
MYDYDEDGEGGRSTGRMIAIGVGAVLVAALGWFVVKPALGGGDDSDANVGSGTATTLTASADSAAEQDGSESTDASIGSVPETTVPDSEASTDQAPTTTDAGTTTGATVTTTLPPSTTAAPAYETLPNGEPAPVIVTFGDSSIKLTGAVPDEASKQRLQDLAIGASKPGQAALVDNQLTINPAVPRTVGARVVELTSTRFPDGSSEVLPAHAAELDRAVDIMNALPNITATIIGHADQRGDSLENYALSEDRALAVKNYMVSRGVDADRLQSRAVGEDDLLTLNDDAAALALNRRTEFVFVGLLTP